MADTKEKDALNDLQMEVVPPVAGKGSSKKVELDLDDAPFLRREEEQKSAPPARPASRPPAVPETAPDNGSGKKKKLLIMAGIALAAVIALVAVWWFLLRSPAAPPPDVPAGPEPEIIVVPSKTVPAPPVELLKPFEPFWIENKDQQGKTRFLVCSFSVVCPSPKIESEIDRNMVVIRDAVFFYLRNKTFDELLDAAHIAEMKKDFANIVNNYLSDKQIKDVLYESYVGQ